MTPFEHDIIDLHIALEDWLGKGEGDPDALLARFRPDFLMIPPGGVQIDYRGLASFLEKQRGSRPGLKSVIDDLTTIHYRETQNRPDLPVNVRWSTAVLSQEGDNITWRLLHETAAQP